MDFSQTIEARKSVRKFTSDTVPEAVIAKALDHALLAPNSSNLQTWNFYQVQSQSKKQKLIRYCLNQSAARTASELVVITANPTLWQRSLPFIKQYIKDVNAPSPVKAYYKEIVPFFYQPGIFGIKGYIKKLILELKGLKQPVMRGPLSRKELELVSVKSAALAAQNFALSITQQGYSSCMMEGFDEKRVKSLLKLSKQDRIVMVIALGKEAPRAIWGPRFRIPKELVVHKV